MRFAIRDLLWLTVVVALGVGWWMDRGRLESDLARRARDEEQLRVLTQMQKVMLERFSEALEGDPRSQRLGEPDASASAPNRSTD